MIQKLSTRPPDLENRIKVLEEIAAESGIPLQLHEGSSASTEVSKFNKQKVLRY